MQSDMKEIRNNRKLEKMNVIDLFKSERLDVKSEEDCLSTEQQIESEPAPDSDQQDSKSNVRLFLHTVTINEYPLDSGGSGSSHSGHGINSLPKAGNADFSTEQSNENTVNFKSTTMSSEKEQSINTLQKGPTLPPTCPNCSAKCAEPAVKAEVGQPPQDVESKNNVVIVEEEAVESIGNNLLKKYDFIKSYINKRYFEKYEELEKKLSQESETDANPSTSIPPEPETNAAGHSRISARPISEMLNNIEDDDVLILESDSDSEVSILEVPISPKPQPPIVNLQDSDEEIEFENRETIDTTEEHTSLELTSFNPGGTGFDFQHNKQMQWVNSSDDYVNDWAEEDDMVLNCTGVQKGASSIKQIKDMCKLAENDQTCSTVSNSNDGTCQFYIDASRDDNQLQFLSTTNQQDLLMKTAINNTVVPKTGLLPYEHGQPLLRKKRPHENDQELSNSAKQKRHSLERDIEPSTSTANRFQDPRISNDGSQAQELFDIHKVLSGMSKDPRRWAILDEDLMPCPRRQRFWNVRCTICQQEGHIRQNCPTPRKLPSCRICGIVGHIDTRCPEKMCLTVEELISCGKKQGTFRKTCESCRILYCNMCKAIGHKLSGCPDLWRRFHQTTEKAAVDVPANPADVMKPANLLVCCNCTKRGHDASTCREYRWSQHFVTPAFVSNYTDGPQYTYPLPEHVEVNVRNTADQNQEKNSTPKLQKTRSATIAAEKSTSSAECSVKERKNSVVFATGCYKVKHNKPHHIEAKISKKSGRYNLAGIKEARQKPKFLKTLLNIVDFEVKIVSHADGTLLLKVIASPDHSSKIYGLLRHWLQLEDRDRAVSILTHLPTTRTVMLDLLQSKLQEFGEQFAPIDVLTEVKYTKDRLSNIKDSAERSETEKKLFELQCKLVRLFQTKPMVDNPVQEVMKVIRVLEEAKDDTVNTTLYLRILLLYNKIFRPYTPPFIEKYLFQGKKNKCKNAMIKLNQFSKEITKLNRALAKKNKQRILIKYTPDCCSTSSAPVIQTMLQPDYKGETCTRKEAEQDRRIMRSHTRKTLLETPTSLNSLPVLREQRNLAPADQTSSTRESFAANLQRLEAECNKSPTPTPTNSAPVIPTQEDNTSSNKESQVTQPIEHLNSFPNTSDARLQSDSPQSTKKSTSKSKKKCQTQSTDLTSLDKEAKMSPAAELLETLPSTADARLQSDEPQNTTKQSSKSKKRNQTQSADSPSLEKDAKLNLSEEHLEVFPSTADVALQSGSPQCSTKQSSKSKKKIHAPCNETVDLETEARELIQTALEFEVPYITKPAMDIERRLKDKSIEEKHITVLRKLIKLERKHQKKKFDISDTSNNQSGLVGMNHIHTQTCAD